MILLFDKFDRGWIETNLYLQLSFLLPAEAKLVCIYQKDSAILFSIVPSF